MHEDFSAVLEGCTTIIYPASGFEDGKFSVSGLSWAIEKSIHVDSGEVTFKLTDLNVRFDADSRDLFAFGGNCNPGLVISPDQVSHWDLVFFERHSDQDCGVLGTGDQRLEALCAGSTGIYIFEGWQILGDELFATLEWNREGLYTESGSFLIYHRPGK